MPTPERRLSSRDAPPPPADGTELDVLCAFLNYLRTSAVAKLDGVSEAAARVPHVASGTNLIGLIRHLTHVEAFYLLDTPVTDWSGTFHAPASDTIGSVLRDYRTVVARADDVVATWDDLSLSVPRGGSTDGMPSRRWVLTHLIEETGRHAGHLDILRELSDGRTGR